MNGICGIIAGSALPPDLLDFLPGFALNQPVLQGQKGQHGVLGSPVSSHLLRRWMLLPFPSGFGQIYSGVWPAWRGSAR